MHRRKRRENAEDAEGRRGIHGKAGLIPRFPRGEREKMRLGSSEMAAKKTAGNGANSRKKTTSRTKAQPKKAKRELTADEAFMKAWEYTYKNRHKRVA
jgi:hypothetical protein